MLDSQECPNSDGHRGYSLGMYTNLLFGDQGMTNSETGKGVNLLPNSKTGKGAERTGNPAQKAVLYKELRNWPTVKREGRGQDSPPTVKRVGREESTMRNRPPSPKEQIELCATDLPLSQRVVHT